MPLAFTRLVFHVVFATRGCRPWLQNLNNLAGSLGLAIRAEGSIAYRIGSGSNHVHLLIRLRDDQSLATLVAGVKARSALEIRSREPELPDFDWQENFSAFSVSHSKFESVVRFVDAQPDYHRRHTYREELLDLLDVHEVEYDERLLWV